MGATRKNNSTAINSGAPDLNPVIQSQPTTTPRQDNQANFNYADCVGKFHHPVSLSEAGRKYIETLTKRMMESQSPAISITVKTITVPNDTEVRVVLEEKSKTYIILIFQESYRGNSLDPAVNMTPEIKNLVKVTCGDYSLIQTIVVQEADYERVDKMSSHLVNCFYAMNIGSNVNADVFANMAIVPDADIRSVRKFIDDRCPHAILPRIDWGILLRREVRQNTTVGYTTERTSAHEPVMAIGGYTRFVRESNGVGNNIYPICVITNITSDIPCPNVLAVALPTVASEVIFKGGWKRLYTTIANDKPNLGRLITDNVKKELKFFSTVAEMEEEIARSFFAPQLALEVPEGRAHIIGFENFYQRPDLLNEIARSFYGYQKDQGGNALIDPTTSERIPLWQGNINPISAAYINIEGNVIFEGRTVDTSECDYLNLVTSLKSTNLQLEQFLSQYPQLDARIKNIVAILGADTVVATYRANTIVFSAPFINQLAAYLQNVVRYIGEVNVASAMNLAAVFAAQGQNAVIGGNSAIYGSCAQSIMPAPMYMM